MINNLNNLCKFWKNKKVFLTGHTGFKGCWFSIILNLLGAKIVGYSLKPTQKLNFFELANLESILEKSIIGDIRDYKKLKESINKFKPDFVVHMAAQSLVKESYNYPKYTYEVNTLGTVNVLNILKELNYTNSALIITTDKVYENWNNKVYYKEDSNLGGADPYSNSKSCAELAVSAYINSFFKDKNISVATARAGNVIGGGDFSLYRIIPDYFRSFKKKKLFLRSPNSIRPWQHVIDPLYGYLLLLRRLYYKKDNCNEHAWNFGPKKSNNKSVFHVINTINSHFNNSITIIKKPNLIEKHYESKILMLNSEKSKRLLKWEAKYDLNKAVKIIVDWQKSFIRKENILLFRYVLYK